MLGFVSYVAYSANAQFDKSKLADNTVALPEKMIENSFEFTNDEHLKQWADGIINKVGNQVENQIKTEMNK